MKFLKNTLFWAVLVLAGLAQDASASRFIVLGDKIQEAVYSEKTKSASLKEGTIGFGADGAFKIILEVDEGPGYTSRQWVDFNGDATPLVIDVPNVASASALESLLKKNDIGTKASRWVPKKEGQWFSRFELITWQMAIDEANRQDLFEKVSVDQIKRECAAVKRIKKIGKAKKFKDQIQARIRAKKEAEEEQALIKVLGDNLGCQYAGLSAETGVKFLTQEKIAALIQALGAIPEEQQTEKSKQKLAWLRAAVKSAEAGDDASEGDDDESDDGKAPQGDEDPADPKGKPKPKDEPKSLYSRLMSVHAGYRYGGAHVALPLVASMLQVMYEGYRGVGFEAKDLAELSVLKKVLRAFKVSLSPARHAANAKALFRVLRPQVQKGVVTPKILARAKQFAKDKPLVLAGLLSLIAVDVYGVCVHADDIKAFVQSLRK